MRSCCLAKVEQIWQKAHWFGNRRSGLATGALILAHQFGHDDMANFVEVFGKIEMANFLLKSCVAATFCLKNKFW